MALPYLSGKLSATTEHTAIFTLHVHLHLHAQLNARVDA